MKKNLIGIVLIIILILPVFSGCTEINIFKNDKNRIVGTWKGLDKDLIEYFIFNKDNSGNIIFGKYDVSFKYYFKDKKLTLNYIDAPIEKNFKYVFFSDNILKLELLDDKNESFILERVD